jgi:hypothetical protein
MQIHSTQSIDLDAVWCTVIAMSDSISFKVEKFALAIQYHHALGDCVKEVGYPHQRRRLVPADNSPVTEDIESV